MNRPRIDLVLFSLVIALVATGLVTVYSTSYPRALATATSSDQSAVKALTAEQTEALMVAQEAVVRKQLRWAGLGLVCLFLAMLMPYHWLSSRWFATILLIFSLALLIAVLVVGYDHGRGSRRWLYFMQPSELAKIAIGVYLAHALAGPTFRIERRTSFLRVFAVVAVVLALVLIEPHLGATLVIASTAMVVLYAAGASVAHLLGVVASGLAVVAFSVATHPYQLARIQAWLHPTRFPDSIGYHTLHCGTALARGGLVGRGLGRSIEKFLYLPECSTDSILAVFGEETGFLGAALLLFLFGMVAARGLRIARRCGEDRFGRLLAIGLTASVCLQALLNFGVTTGLLPQTGVGLPFISYGGSSLLCTMTSMGLLLNVCRCNPEPCQPSSPARRRVERPGLAPGWGTR